MCIPFEHLTREHSQQLRNCLKLSTSVQNSYWGKMDCYLKFVYLFHGENVNQLKASKIASFLVT